MLENSSPDLLQKYVISVGTIYVDVSCLNFPFDDGLMAHRETTGKEYDLVAGGSAFNFARLCQQIGLTAIFVGKRGNDPLGDLLEQLITQSGVRPCVSIDQTAQTNVAVHYVREDGASIMTSVGTANQSLTPEEVTRKLTKVLPDAHYIYFGGCFKLKSLLPAYAELAKLAQKYDVKVVVDHGRINNSVTSQNITQVKKLIAEADYYLPSKDEFLSTWEADTIEQGLKIARETTRATIIVKNSEQGVMIDENGTTTHAPAFPVKVLNSVGAGDSFNAGLLTALSSEKGLVECVQFANAVAAIKISSLNEISLEKVNQLLEKK